MRFHLEVDCDNAAFEEMPEQEVARLLRAAADKVEGDSRVTNGNSMGLLRDHNGNTVGHYFMKEEQA